MSNRRLLYLTLIVATLAIGVVIGTIVSGGVKATAEQKAATLVIPDPVSMSNAFSQIASQLEPTVVNISTETTVEQPRRRRNNQPDPFDFFDFFGTPDPDRPYKSGSLGTGFIVDKAGYILTNHHVVENADKITVRLDDKSEHSAKVIGSDTETDLAVVKIDVGRDLPTAKLGNSDAASVGDWVLALGSPFGLDHTVTAGIVSAKGRQSYDIGGSQQFQTFIQTDAAINRGNSGGPLVNMAGEVIGVNTAIVSQTGSFAGLGFALPSNIAVRIYNQLVQTGKVTRGGIGITYLNEQDPALFRAFGLQPGAGVVVQDVTANGPAAKAGVHAGDIITEIDGKKITGGQDLLDAVANTPVGQTIRVKINRDGKEQTIPVMIADRSEVVPESAANRRPNNNGQGDSTDTRLGIRVQSLTPDMVRNLRLPSDAGVIITGVEPGTPAEEAGLARNMVITRVIAGGQRIDIQGIEDFRRAESRMRPGMDVALMVLGRNPQTNEWRSNFIPFTIP